MTSKPAPVWMHLLACACFLTLPFIMRPGSFGEIHLNDFRTISDLAVYVLIAVFFYLNYYWLIPKFYFSHRYAAYFVIVLLCFVSITFLPDLLFPFRFKAPVNMHPGPPPVGNFFFDKTSRHFFIFTAVCLFSLLLKINSRWRSSERQKLNTELSFLRAQINPHFLFNTLNSIYSLAVEKSDETANAVVKLSGMMRYVLNETSNDFVSLQKELDYINDYIDLQQLRFGKSMPLSFTVKGSPAGKQIAPLILMSFIENAFKHGFNAAEQSEIIIEILIERKNISLSAYNKKVTMHITEMQSGVGITNTKKRLELLYPAKHSLTVKDEKDYFSILLNLSFA